MKKIVEWLNQSNRWKHLVGGIIVGAGANDWYCAAYAGFGVAGTLELKDYLWGGKPDRPRVRRGTWHGAGVGCFGRRRCPLPYSS